jgi:hypothetical protein
MQVDPDYQEYHQEYHARPYGRMHAPTHAAERPAPTQCVFSQPKDS